MSNKLNDQIKTILFEDTWNKYGSEYMSHPEDQETTIPPNLPVVPDDLMPNQLAVERPPVEDEKFTPDGVEELSRSVAVLAQQVPAEEVASFYKGVHNLLDQAIAKNNDPETLTAEEENVEVDDVIEQEAQIAQESFQLKRLLKKILKEQSTSWDSTDPRWEKRKKEDWEEESEPTATVKDTIKGKNIAPYYHKASPSGVQNATDRMLQGYFKAMMDVRGEEIDDSSQYLKDNFALLTQDIENVPPEAPQAFLGMIMKKAVKKGTSSDGKFDGRLLFHVVNLWKGLSAKKKATLVDAAIEETHSEMADWETLANTLREEDPDQYEVLMSLNLR